LPPAHALPQVACDRVHKHEFVPRGN
jgi:hypothetical protein